VNSKIKAAVISIVIELVCFSLIGWLFAGMYIFNIHTTVFTYIIFGTSSILLINIIEYFSLRHFVFAAFLFAFIFITAYYRSYMPVALVRNLLWFVLIGVSIYISAGFLNKQKYKTRKFLGAAVWMINFALVYLVMTLINTYIFDYYNPEFINRFLIMAFNMGTSMGLGIGIGYEISRKFVKMPDANQSQPVKGAE